MARDVSAQVSAIVKSPIPLPLLSSMSITQVPVEVSV